MTENYLRQCSQCDKQTIKEDVCSKCRERASHSRVYESVEARQSMRARADEILSMAKEDAKREYTFWNERWKSGETTEEVRYWRAQMFALMNKEEIDEHILT